MDAGLWLERYEAFVEALGRRLTCGRKLADGINLNLDGMANANPENP